MTVDVFVGWFGAALAVATSLLLGLLPVKQQGKGVNQVSRFGVRFVILAVLFVLSLWLLRAFPPFEPKIAKWLLLVALPGAVGLVARRLVKPSNGNKHS